MFAMNRWLEQGFRERILPFDSAAARAYAEIAADRRRAGRPIGEADCQIAAICRSRDAALVTRNVRDLRTRESRSSIPGRLVRANEGVSVQTALGKVIRAMGVKEFGERAGMAGPNVLRAMHPHASSGGCDDSVV